MRQTVTVVVLSIVTLCRGQCLDGWMTFDDYCVFFSETKESWEAADSYCRSFGGRLTSIDNVKKDMNIASFLRFKGYFDPVWTDGTDQLAHGQWVWASSGQPLVYTNWYPSDPDGIGVQDCLALVYVHSTEQWMSRECSQKYAFVCEKETKNGHIKPQQKFFIG